MIEWQGSRLICLRGADESDGLFKVELMIDQIKQRGYDQPYRASGKKIILVGIAFDKEKRAIGDWKSEPAAITDSAHSAD